MDQRTIEIACQGATTVGVEELHELQGSLKTLSENDYVKLRNSIIEFGFSFPVFFWQDPETNLKYTIDAHQRIFTLRKMQGEGYTIPPLPADPIFAKSKVEAKKKLLLLQSRYGKITQEGMTDFLTETGAEVDFTDVSDYLTYPEGDFASTNDAVETGQQDAPTQEKKVSATCPQCNTVFDVTI